MARHRFSVEEQEAATHRQRALDNAFAHAASGGHMHIAEYLLEAGANPRADNSHPLLAAATNGQTKMVQFLLEKGSNHREAMIAAAENNHAETARVIIKWQEQYPPRP
jgi:ankyrin repeat protein